MLDAIFLHNEVEQEELGEADDFVEADNEARWLFTYLEKNVRTSL
jgi:hypothetical protein